jgi:hypothetical protein
MEPDRAAGSYLAARAHQRAVQPALTYYDAFNELKLNAWCAARP